MPGPNDPYGQFTGMPYQGSLFGGGALPNYAGAQGAAGAGGAMPQGPGPTGAAPGGAGPSPQQQAMAMLAMTQGKNQYQIPPAMLQHMADSSQIGMESGNLDKQQKLADMLRSDAGDQLKGVQAGRVYRAPGAANMVASLMGGMYGASQQGGIDEARKKLVQRGQQSVTDVGNAMGGGAQPYKASWDNPGA